MNQEQESGLDFNISSLFRILLKYKVVIALLLLTGLVVSYVFTITSPPRYRAMAQVMVGSSSKNMLGINPGMGSNDWYYMSTRLEDQVQLMMSRTLAEGVIDKIISEGRAKSLELFGNRKYRTAFDGMVNSAEKGFAANSSIPRAEHIPYWAEMLKSRISVNTVKGTNFLGVSVTSPFADEAAYLANKVCEVYQEQDIKKQANQVVATQKYITNQLDEQKRELENIQQHVLDYVRTHRVYTLDEEISTPLNKLIEVESQYSKNRAEYNIAKQRQDFVEKQLSSGDRTVLSKVGTTFNAQSEDLKRDIRKKEKELIALTDELGGDDPGVILKKEELEKLKRKMLDISRRAIAAQLSNENVTKQQQFALIGRQLDYETRMKDLDVTGNELLKLKSGYEREMSSLPEVQLGYARLLGDQAVLQKTYDYLKQKYEEAGMAVAAESGSVTIVDPALVPLRPERPDMQTNLLFGSIAGLLAGAVLAYGLDKLDTTIPDGNFITDKGFVVLSRIPLLSRKNKRFNLDLLHKQLRLLKVPGSLVKKLPFNSESDNLARGVPLWMSDNISSGFAESFRDLRTNITFSLVDTEMKSLVVSGTDPGDGKTTVCSNLGFAYAMIGKKVLVIDCDLRKPSQHAMFSVSRSPGLTEYLVGQEADVMKLITKSSKHENLFVLTSGQSSPHPNELIESKKMADLVKKLEESFDLILIDTPPVLMLSDALLLSQAVDNVLLVAREGNTSKAAIEEVARLGFLKKSLLGFAIIEKYSKAYGYYSKYGYGAYGNGS